jgi:small nuclear ribonucleoprotein (snRNP)-like protein
MLNDYLETIVVVDTDGPTAYIGTLVAVDSHHLLLRDVAIYDRRSANAEYELYLIEAAQYGPSTSRNELIVRHERVIAVSRLGDVV